MRNQKKASFLYRKLLKAFLLFGMLFLVLNLSAQTIAVTGTITDAADGQPIPGANILVKGTTIGIISDLNGVYSLDVPSAESVLAFSFVGYTTVEETVGDRTTIDAALNASVVNLLEVVAVGYGTMRKSDLTGAVASVDVAELQKNAVATVDQALVGKLAGVSVVTNSGTPGGGSSIRIRGSGSIGNSEPLYVIDGVQYTVQQNEYRSPLANLNFNDIESIEVLKDASAAAIYGARAANGVVLIKTKSGKNQKGTVSYNGYMGIQSMPNPIEVMNGQEWEDFVNTSYINNGEPAIITNLGQYPGTGTDWREVCKTETPIIQDHQLSFTGGGPDASNYMSVGYNNVEGLLKWSGFERLSLRSNNERNFGDKFTAGTNLNLVFTDQMRNNNQRNHSNTFYPRMNYFAPTIVPYNADGSIAPVPLEPQYGNHAPPHWFGENEKTENENISALGSVYTRWNIVQPLTWNARVSFRYNNGKSQYARPSYDLGNVSDANAYTTRNTNKSHGYVIENTLNFDQSFGNHSISLMAGNTVEDNDYEYFNTSSQWADDGWIITGDFAPVSSFSNGIQENSMVSFFGRAFYNFGDRYLLTANIRRDGSSRFGANNKWGTFPSVSAAWRISNESFFPQSGAITDWKLRGGWGQIGNEDIGNYKYAATIGTTYAYPFGNTAGQVLSGSSPNQIPNPDLKWETTTTTYFGTDVILFQGKLAIYADYYNNKREDMLLEVPVSGVTGLSGGSGLATTTQNAAALTNSGFEFAVDHKGRFGDFKYSVGVNLTTVKNEITDLGTATELLGFQYNTRVWSKSYIGSSLGEFYGYVFDGVFQTPQDVLDHGIGGVPAQPLAEPGDFIFRDIAGPKDANGNPTGPDGVIDINDQTSMGNPHPDMFYGIVAEAFYKGLDFSIQFSGSQGNDIVNVSKQFLIDGTRGNSNKLKEFYSNYWRGAGSTNEWPRALHADPNVNIRNSTYFVEDGSYFKCRLIQLGYTLPTSVTDRINMQRIRVYASIQNAFTITGYSGPDPEIGNMNGDSNRGGMDYFIYPKPRTISFGVNFDF